MFRETENVRELSKWSIGRSQVVERGALERFLADLLESAALGRQVALERAWMHGQQRCHLGLAGLRCQAYVATPSAPGK